jgi:Flp pilus assembly protein TadD
LLFSTTVLAIAQMDRGAIAGEITITRAGSPSDRIFVSLQTRGITVNQVWTDNEGKFLFRDLPDNLYHVIVRDEKYEPYEQEVRVNPHTNPLNVLAVQLTPKSADKKHESPPPITGANPYLSDVAGYEKEFPAKVLKEYEKGRASQAKGRADEATHHFQTALRLAPDFYPAHNNLGTIYLAQSDFVAAEGEFETARRLKPSDAETYFNLGNVFLLTKRYKDAERNIQEGLQKQPNSGLGYFLLGSLCQQTGEVEESERLLRNALALDPKMVRAHLALVNLYLLQGRNPDAIAELKLFLDVAPNDPFVPKALETLRKLHAEVPAPSTPQ